MTHREVKGYAHIHTLGSDSWGGIHTRHRSSLNGARAVYGPLFTPQEKTWY